MCLYAHQHFWKVRLHLGCVFRCPVPLDCPSEEGPALIQKLALTNLKEISSAFCYCSHPDCVKLPHADKLKWKCWVHIWADRNICFLGGSGAVCALGFSLFRRCYEFCHSNSPSIPTLIPTSLTPHTHTPPCRRGAGGLRQGDRGYTEASSGVQNPPKLNVGLRGRTLKNNQGGMSVCVWGRVHFLN